MILIIITLLFILVMSTKHVEFFEDNPIKIDSTKAKEFIDEKRALLIDVRSRWERKEGHHPASLFVPHVHIRRNHPNLKGVSPSTPLITHCASGFRAKTAAEKLKDLGFKKVFYITTDYKSLI